MSFEIAQVDSFSHQLARAPKPVQNAMKRIIPELRSEPDKVKPPKIKKQKELKDHWRYRVKKDYRLIYRVDKGPKVQTVTLLLLGHKKKVDDRLGLSDDGKPSIRILASGVADLLEVEPSPEQVGEAIIAMALDETDEPDPGAALPVVLTAELLEDWGVPTRYHSILTASSTEGQLIGAEVPGEVIERVMDGLWPPPIERVLQEPVRVVPDEDSLLAASQPDQDLVHLLLKLDSEQEALVSRFERANPSGPWLLKGGPGSGKSVVALYCIKALVAQEAGKLPGQRRTYRILFTTYTKSLVNTAQQLMRELNAGDEAHEIEVRTTDSLARAFAAQKMPNLKSNSDREVRDAATRTLQSFKATSRAFPFDEADVPYLLDEVEWVIVGQDLNSVDDYVNNADRTGRRRQLGRNQREQVWLWYEKLYEELKRRDLALWVDQQRDALRNAKPTYDYVFVDEAQDLKPIAIRFLQRLAKQPENLFVTADSNQSIYGTGMPWSRVAEDVNFQGRARNLKKNYRTTREIWQAVSQLLPDAEDKETMAVDPVYSGSSPIFVTYNDLDEWGDRLNRFLFEALREERLGADSAAVLVPWNKTATEVAARLSPKLRPRAFKGRDVDIKYPGVKVLTMHSAKGLEFPVVAIAAANEEFLPGRPYAGEDPDEHQSRQRRLLYVAATRAMRQLMILARAGQVSPFLAGVTDEFWEIERL